MKWALGIQAKKSYYPNHYLSGLLPRRGWARPSTTPFSRFRITARFAAIATWFPRTMPRFPASIATRSRPITRHKLTHSTTV